MRDEKFSDGHGHVLKRSDGLVARCGGPWFCRECALEFAEVNHQKVQQEGKPNV